MKKKKKQITHLPSGKNNRIIYLIFLVLVPLTLYFRVVNFGLSSLDDASLIANINKIEGSKFNLKEAFTHDVMMSDKPTAIYRPIPVISFMIDAELGKNELWLYHLSNLLLHLFTVIVLFFFLKRIGIKEDNSFLLALLFSIHPLFTNAVAWIPARGDILLCLFSLLSFITFLEYYETKKTVYLILHAIVFLSAIFSKETSALLPILNLSYVYFVQKNKFKLKDIIPILIIWTVAFILFFALRQSVINYSSNDEFGIVPFIKNLVTIPIIFGKFFIPFNLSPMPCFENTAIIIGIILLIFFTFLIIKVLSSEKRIVIWGAIWFLAFSIPPMFFRSYFANIGFDYFEYRSYLPLIGILLIIGFLITALTNGIIYKRILIVSIPLLLVYSLIAFIYSEDFTDPHSFLNSVIKSNPNNALALQMRGTEYFISGNYEKAILDYDKSIRISPTYSVPYYNKGLIYFKLKDYSRAENSFSLALKYDTLDKNNLLYETSYQNLSVTKLSLRKYDEAILALKKAISKYPNMNTLHLNLGVIYFYSAQFDSALHEYNRVIESGMVSPQVYNGRGMVKDSLMDFTGAIEDFTRALELKQDFFDALKNRGMTRIIMNDYEGGASDLTAAININPNVGLTWYYRGLAFSKLNKPIEAERDWTQARKLGFMETEIERKRVR